MDDTRATDGSACGLCENPVKAAILLTALVVLFAVEVSLVWMLV